MSEKFHHQSSPVWNLKSMSEVYEFFRNYFISDIVSQNLSLKYRSFKLKANDPQLKMFLMRKYNMFTITQNITELPPPVRNHPGCLFFQFTHSLLESVKENRPFLEKLSENIQFFTQYSQI